VILLPHVHGHIIILLFVYTSGSVNGMGNLERKYIIWLVYSTSQLRWDVKLRRRLLGSRGMVCKARPNGAGNVVHALQKPLAPFVACQPFHPLRFRLGVRELLLVCPLLDTFPQAKDMR